MRRGLLLHGPPGTAISDSPTVEGQHLDEALRELEAGGQLTRSILGAGGNGHEPRPPRPAC